MEKVCEAIWRKSMGFLIFWMFVKIYCFVLFAATDQISRSSAKFSAEVNHVNALYEIN